MSEIDTLNTFIEEMLRLKQDRFSAGTDFFGFEGKLRGKIRSGRSHLAIRSTPARMGM